MGRLRLDICRCVEPRAEDIVSGGGRVLGRVCRACHHMVTDWRRSRHTARLEQLEAGPLAALCVHTGADSADAVFTLLALCAPKGEPEEVALWILDQVCTTGRHVHAPTRRGRRA